MNARDTIFQGSRPGPSSSTLTRREENLEGIFRSYHESSTTYYDYHVWFITWIDHSTGNGNAIESYDTFCETTVSDYTTFEKHTQESLNKYTQNYRESRTEPMPGEVIVSKKTEVKEAVWWKDGQTWIDLVRPAADESPSAGSQVVSQVVAETMAAPSTVQYTVQPGDSWWDISKRFLGDGSRYAELLALNAEMAANPDLIYPGQRINLPNGLTVPVAKPSVAAAPSGGVSYQVRPEDTLWSLAGDVYSDPTRWPELAAMNSQLQNPNSLVVGQTLTLPKAPGATPPTTNLASLDLGYSDPETNMNFTAFPSGSGAGPIQVSPKGIYDAGTTDNEMPASADPWYGHQ